MLYIGAAVCLASALVVLMVAGLPQRGVASAVESDGLTFAPEPGYFAPLFSGATLDGEAIALTELRGKPAVINFWATWCAPCAAEMPELQRLHDAFGDQVAVVGINTGEPAQTAGAWAQQRNLTFPLVLDEAGEIAALYQLRGQPTTFVLNPEGQIMEILYGPTTFDDLSQRLTAYLTA